MNPLYRKLKTAVSSPSSKSDEDVLSLQKENHSLSLINGLKQTIFQINENGQWLYLNTEWEKLTGFTVNDTLGKDMMQHIHPDDKEQYIEFIQSIYKNDPISSSLLTIRFLTKDNRFCWVNMRANAYLNPENKKTHLVGVISDITERVREYGLHQAKHRTLYTLINNLCGLVYRGRNDRDWTMEFVSEGCFELTGYRPSELINQTVTFGSLINPNDQDLVWTNVQSALRENRPYELNYRIRTSDKREKWVWERGKGNFASNGELLSIEGLIVDITDYKRNKQRENEEILYKTKTKLPHKQLFLDRLNAAIVRNKAVKTYHYALLILYIDRFKKLKERFPTDVIDKIIIDVSKKINSSILPTSSLCQFGDGEFGLLLEHVESTDTVRAIVKNIQKTLLTPVKINNTETYITISIGIYLNNKPKDDRKTVINNTYTALSRAKSLGGSRYEIFDEATNAKTYAIDRMETEILYALENNELGVFYSPIVDIDKNLTKNIEAQLFWQHPRMGKVSSDFFSDIKTNHDIVIKLNKWLITSVINQVKLLESQAKFNKNLEIYIQFFANSILTDDFLNVVEEQLSSTLYNKFNFSISLAEESIYRLQQHQIDRLYKLQNKKGINLIFSADKFIFSLNKDLFKLPFNLVKINYAVCPPNDKQQLKLIKAQIKYLHTMEKKVAIFNINNQKDHDLIKALDCDYIQGDIVCASLNNNDVFETMINHNHG